MYNFHDVVIEEPILCLECSSSNFCVWYYVGCFVIDLNNLLDQSCYEQKNQEVVVLLIHHKYTLMDSFVNESAAVILRYVAAI